MSERYQFFDQNPVLQDVVAEVKQGLRASPKRLAPKYFYDAQGSELFEQITELPEYYLTRTEIDILRDNRREMAELIGQNCCLIEYGSGSSTKIRLLIDAIEPKYYVPVDISKEHLNHAARSIHDDFNALHVYPTCADYTEALQLPPVIDGAPRCGFFPGSSIGNFEREDARRFMRSLGTDLGAGAHCIVGFDSRKSKSILEPAYNDAQGVTAAFNLNLLRHLNQAIGTDFVISSFDHHAFYDEDQGRIEMHLVSKTNQCVTIDGESVSIGCGESIHTENSYKYSLDEVKQLGRNAGLVFVTHWEDSKGWFYVALFKVPNASDTY